MKDLLEIALLVGVLLVVLIAWALALATPDEPRPRLLPEPIAMLWHPVAPLTDWTPHTSTVMP